MISTTKSREALEQEKQRNVLETKYGELREIHTGYNKPRYETISGVIIH